MADYDNAGQFEVAAGVSGQQVMVNINTQIARHPDTFDVLRELIQNADDAGARSVQVHFHRTKEPKKCQPASELDVSKVHKWIIMDDGNGFEEKDWGRLGEIAHGNDDSRKVGAFGVGFYSVLSKSDRPLVRSNGKSLQFDKGKDGKLTKFPADCPVDSWTSIELELRKPEPLPMLADLTRFLVSSVAFLTHIDTFSVHLDSQRVLRVEKQVESSVEIPIPDHLKPTTPQEALTVESIQRTAQRITVDAKGALASSLMSPSHVVDTTDILLERLRISRDYRSAHTKLEEHVITHDLYTATICVNLHPDSEMKKSLESRMKLHPSSLKCKAVYFNSKQSLLGINNSHTLNAKHLSRLSCGSHGIFPENNSGRLFTGHSNSQTTGIGLHISAHFLPTTECGSMNLSQVSACNKEILWVGGILARVIYEEEMNAAKSKGGLATQLGLLTMARFAFRPTIPESGVSQFLEHAFFSCCHRWKSPFPVVSDIGIACASDSRFRQKNMGILFLKRYLVLHQEIEPHQRSQITIRYGIPLYNLGDIVREFETGVTRDVMRSFFFWWGNVNRKPLAPSSSPANAVREKFCKEFASRGVLRSSHGIKIAFKNIKYYTFFPLPNDLSPSDNIDIDIAVRLGVPTKDSVECFGWGQLSLLDWLEYACSQARWLTLKEDSNQDLVVGCGILRALARFALVEDLSLQQWDQAAELVKDISCIPTNMGLKQPANSYFSVADVCGCLPIVSEGIFRDIPVTPVAVERGFEYRSMNSGHVRKVLARIRVRRMMDWADMVRRLESVASEDSNRHLLWYLATIHRGKLTDGQINDLKERRVFYSENHGRASATELLLPNDEDMRKLGLPILALPQHAITSLQSVVDAYGSFVVETFIESLGIQKYPTLDKIIAQAASDEPEVQRHALQYLLSNLETRYDAYKPDDFAQVAFIPTNSGSLAGPNEVFASPIWEKLGFKQVSEALRRDLSRLGVKDDPSADKIIESLKTPERTLPDLDTAAIWFEHLYLHGKLPIPKLREQLSTIPFVPVKNPDPSSSESSPIQYFSPKDCFITSTDTKEHYHDIFPFVDFGQNGNSFLDSCCAKKSPDASDILRKIIQNPQRYMEILRDDTNLYLGDLRAIASGLDSISEDDKQAMKKAPMFLAFWKRVGGKKLLPAGQVVISDWESRDFGGDVFVAPKDNILEKMYCEMGSVYLGTYVRHDILPSGDKAEHDPPFNRDQVIRRISFFMNLRDKSGKTDVLFHDQGSTNNLRVRTCKTLTLTKTFAPPFEVFADAPAAGTVETAPVKIKAGFEFDEIDESYTLWMVRGSSESVDLRNDIAVALCHVLLKVYGPNDVLLLASLFAMGDESLEGYYDSSEVKSKLPSAPDAKGDIVDDTISQSTVLENIQYFTFLSLPSDLSSPDTIHIELAQDSPTSDAVQRFGWTQLSLLHWLEYACSHARQVALNEESTQDVGYRILRVLIQFALVDDLLPQQWDRAADFMKDLQCIPTNIGFKSPTDSYFEEADVSGSLPVVDLDRFLDIPVTPVTDEGGFRFRSVTLEHIRVVLTHIRVCRMTEWEDGLGHSLHDLCTQASDLTDHVIREGRDPVARGGFADIYRGLLHSNGESIRVAIKAIRTYLSSDGDFTKDQKRLRREIKVWLSLKHTNVLPFLGTTTGFGRFPAIVCPWVESGPLTCYLQEHHSSLLDIEILTLLNDVASGIQYLHSCSVVHGDLSGSNVLIGKNGRARICDFGLSTLLTELGGSTFATSTRAAGTLRWAAPELLNPGVSEDEKEEPLSALPTLSSDVYSFGRVMLQILTGKMPYYYLSDLQVAYAISMGTTPRQPSCDVMTERQWAFIQRCWSTVDAANSRPSSEEILDFTESEIAESNVCLNW